MLSDLRWQRRKHIHLALLYTIVHHVIVVPHEVILLKADSRTRSTHNYKYRSLRSHEDPNKYSFYHGLNWNGTATSEYGAFRLFFWHKNRILPAPPGCPPAASSEMAASIQLAFTCTQAVPPRTYTPHMEVCRVNFKSGAHAYGRGTKPARPPHGTLQCFHTARVPQEPVLDSQVQLKRASDIQIWAEHMLSLSFV